MPFDTRQPLSIQATRTINVGRGSGNGGGVLPAPAGTWQYPANEGWYETGSREMYLVGPHPDPVTDPTSDVDPNAGHLWASPDFPYEQDLFVIFGSPPWYFELLEGPTGMVIGEFMQVENGILKYHTDYGKVIWPNPTDVGQPADGWLVRVRVRDQDFNRGHSELIAEWRVKVDAGKFLIIANGGDNSNPGTWAQPKADFDGWYLGDETSTQFEGMHVVFRDGSYVPRGDFENANGNIALWRNGGRHPKTFIVPRGETALFDCREANWIFWGGQDDISFKGHFVFDDSKVQNPDETLIANCRNISFLGSANSDRVYFSGIDVDNLKIGSSGTDNPAFVWRPDSFPDRGSDWAIKSAKFGISEARSFTQLSGLLPSCVDNIAAIGVVFDGWQGEKSLQCKSAVTNYCYYFIDMWNIGENSHWGIGTFNGTGYDPLAGTGGGDYLYCKGRNDSNGVNNAIMSAYWQTNEPATLRTMTLKRNTLRGYSRVGSPETYPIVVDKSIVFGGTGNEAVFATGDNIRGSSLSGIDQYIDLTTGEVTDPTLIGKYGATLIDPATVQE